ncbi:hypothetical protein [Streptomyces sp. NPDC086787]|uniref:hypothetical protein n=1 Tax=Streptomyces sp. NPDC086787 TaxID=3365759 RepID=UPI0038069179
MLRITDARTGETVDATPARRSLTRVEVHAPAAGLPALRVLLVADTLVRALELGGTPVWAMLSGGDGVAELRAAAATLGIRPFEDARGLAAALGEAQTVHVTAGNGQVPDRGVVLAVAPVVAEEPGAGDAVSGQVLPEPLDDPAALRLALLAVPRDTPVRLGGDMLDEAGRTLARWRRAVATWSRQPSRPVPEEVRGRLRAAWEDDLDLPEVLRVLHTVETATGQADLPDGARFETYAYIDRLLGLDLVRDLGTLA